MSRYRIEIHTTASIDELIECTTLKEVIGELMTLATRTDIEEITAYDTQRVGQFGYHAFIIE